MSVVTKAIVLIAIVIVVVVLVVVLLVVEVVVGTVRGEKVNHKLESRQLSGKDQISVSRQRSSHHSDLKYWLHNFGRALDTVCRKCGMGRRQLNT